MTDPKEIVRELRCTKNENDGCRTCAYQVMYNGRFDHCNTEKLEFDAADLIESLTAQFEAAKANAMIQEHIITNSHNPFDKDKIVRLIMEKAELEQQITESRRRDAPSVCTEEVVNHGMNVSGEYDIDAYLLCPICGAAVGDAEYQELNGDYCHKCGQRIMIAPQQDEEAN